MDFEIVAELPDSQGRLSGWKPLSGGELQDLQDKHPAQLEPHLSLPNVVDLRQFLPPVYDQGLLNSCTSNAVAGLLQYLRAKQHIAPFLPSRMHLYWYQRLADGTQNENAACSVVSAFNVASTRGYCPDALLPYGPAFQSPPSPAADIEARHHKSAPFVAPRDFGELKSLLASYIPIAFGFYYFNSFFQADLNGGYVPMRQPTDTGAMKHAALIVGYSDASATVTIRNSWGLLRKDGKPCGDHGHYYLPYAYLNDPNLCSEFLTSLSVAEFP